MFPLRLPPEVPVILTTEALVKLPHLPSAPLRQRRVYLWHEDVTAALQHLSAREHPHRLLSMHEARLHPLYVLPKVQHPYSQGVKLDRLTPTKNALVGTDLHRLLARHFQAGIVTHDALRGWLTAYVA